MAFRSRVARLAQCRVAASVAGSAGAWIAAAGVAAGATQFVNAAALEVGGAGIALLGEDATAERIRATLQRLLHEASFRAQAARVPQDIAAMPGADDVAQVLEQR